MVLLLKKLTKAADDESHVSTQKDCAILPYAVKGPNGVLVSFLEKRAGDVPAADSSTWLSTTLELG